MIGTVNGTNFTDGLDGLAASVTVMVAVFFSVVAVGTDAGIAPVTLAVAGGFIVGATAAGGVLQLVTATMTDLFPASKAKCVSAVMIAGALSQFSATVMASKLAEMFGMEYSLLVAVGFTVLGIVLAVVVNIRYAIIEKSLAAEGKSL